MAAPAGAPRRRRSAPWHARSQAGPRASRGECSRRVYAMAAHRSAQTAPPRSAAERAVVAGGVHPGMHWPRGRSREGAARRSRPGASTDRHGPARHRPIPPSCVTTATASLWVRHRRTARPSACPIPSQVSPTVGIATKSPLCTHTSLHFSAGFRRRPTGPLPTPLGCTHQPFSRPGRACPAAVRRRSPADRYRSAVPVRSPREDDLSSRPGGLSDP